MIITLKSEEVEVQLSTYGAAIVGLMTKDKNGVFGNIVLSHSEEVSYKKNKAYFGATCGRVAGRITNAEFEIDGVKYELSKNCKGKHTHHGGSDNLTFKDWDYETVEDKEKSICRFKCMSKHLDQGFPANVEVTCEYVLERNELSINYYGSADCKTYLNLTNHSYFNLSNDENIYGHDLQIDSSKYVVTDENIIYQSISSVDGTEFDFRKSAKLNGLSDKKDAILSKINGYDSCFILDKSGMGYDLYLKDENSGRSLKCITTYPSAVIYTYNSAADVVLLDRKNVAHAGVAIEFQYAPNAMNVEGLYIPIIDENRPYKESIKFIFNE